MEPRQASRLHPVERGGREDYVPSSDVEAKTALKVIGRRVSKGSSVYTDCFKAYRGLSMAGYGHEAVNHSVSEWVRGECHINSCENRASLLRPWLAVHRGICKDNISLYTAAFKAYRRARRLKPVEALTEILRTILIYLILMATLRITQTLKNQPNHKILI